MSDQGYASADPCSDTYFTKNVVITGMYDATFCNEPISPSISVKIDNKTQTEGKDYEIHYLCDHKNVGVVQIFILGKGNNTGVIAKDFNILYTDGPKTHSYQKAVYWASRNRIASGYSGIKTGYFGVNDEITRGQVVKFLWNAAGKPEPKRLQQSFSDVPVKHNFYKAIQWAYENRIVAGYSDGRFGPSDKCTRGQIATFLWRYKHKPTPKKNTQTFTDIPTNHSFYKAIQWASEQGITTGFSDGTFGSNRPCTRGQCVTFLYRMLG